MHSYLTASIKRGNQSTLTVRELGIPLRTEEGGKEVEDLAEISYPTKGRIQNVHGLLSSLVYASCLSSAL